MAHLVCVLFLLGTVSVTVCRGQAGKSGNASDTETQATFATPEEAGEALQTAARNRDETTLVRILGPDSKAILNSGDAQEDEVALASFVTKYDRMNRWVTMTDGNRILYIGADNYPYPIPLTLDSSSKWYFNTAAGEDEIVARRIGNNELLAIDAVSAIANAQELYFKSAHDGKPAHEYARKILSSPGKQDGLYWQVAKNQPSSPLGRVDDFAKDVISSTQPDADPTFDGYSFRILTAQGQNAGEGAKSYLAGGKMAGGFAILATPVKYQDSGIMTFILSRDGIVYQKDLGTKTTDVA
ncbi:MAG TPA: DUF2950 family protein, partial [Alloacidobacterium sp.]|nr:DUF2950 family protein [Alloacidobacterium sp.]